MSSLFAAIMNDRLEVASEATANDGDQAKSDCVHQDSFIMPLLRQQLEYTQAPRTIGQDVKVHLSPFIEISSYAT